MINNQLKTMGYDLLDCLEENNDRIVFYFRNVPHTEAFYHALQDMACITQKSAIKIVRNKKKCKFDVEISASDFSLLLNTENGLIVDAYAALFQKSLFSHSLEQEFVEAGTKLGALLSSREKMFNKQFKVPELEALLLDDLHPVNSYNEVVCSAKKHTLRCFINEVDDTLNNVRRLLEPLFQEVDTIEAFKAKKDQLAILLGDILFIMEQHMGLIDVVADEAAIDKLLSVIHQRIDNVLTTFGVIACITENKEERMRIIETESVSPIIKKTPRQHVKDLMVLDDVLSTTLKNWVSKVNVVDRELEETLHIIVNNTENMRQMKMVATRDPLEANWFVALHQHFYCTVFGLKEPLFGAITELNPDGVMEWLDEEVKTLLLRCVAFFENTHRWIHRLDAACHDYSKGEHQSFIDLCLDNEGISLLEKLNDINMNEMGDFAELLNDLAKTISLWNDMVAKYSVEIKPHVYQETVKIDDADMMKIAQCVKPQCTDYAHFMLVLAEAVIIMLKREKDISEDMQTLVASTLSALQLAEAYMQRDHTENCLEVLVKLDEQYMVLYADCYVKKMKSGDRDMLMRCFAQWAQRKIALCEQVGGEKAALFMELKQYYIWIQHCLEKKIKFADDIFSVPIDEATIQLVIEQYYDISCHDDVVDDAIVIPAYQACMAKIIGQLSAGISDNELAVIRERWLPTAYNNSESNNNLRMGSSPVNFFQQHVEREAHPVLVKPLSAGCC